MAYKLTIDVPERPEGDLIEVPPYGLLENGTTLELDISEAEAQRLSRGHGFIVEEGTPTPDEDEEEEEEEGEGGEDE